MFTFIDDYYISINTRDTYIPIIINKDMECIEKKTTCRTKYKLSNKTRYTVPVHSIKIPYLYTEIPYLYK